jgi:serine/threonine protein kinase
MGEVWLAWDEELGDRLVAIKVMHSRMLADADDAARFQREMRLASRMQHQNIMTVFTTGSDNGVPFMVMEYLEGSDLGKLPPYLGTGEVARIGRETCAALAYAHGLNPGVVHRDIKPGNLFICDSGQVKVTDFGIAKAIGGTNLTVAGSLIGTLPYMAPEQLLGEPTTFSNDIWAVGCVLYELLSGRLPRSYATPTEYLAAAVRREGVLPLPDTAPPWLADAVAAMLQPDPASRPSAAECVQLLSEPSAHAAPAPAMLESARRDSTANARWPQQATPQQATTQPDQPGAPPGLTVAPAGKSSLRRGRARSVALAATAVVVLAAAYLVTRGHDHAPPAASGSSTRTTTPSAATQSASSAAKAAVRADSTQSASSLSTAAARAGSTQSGSTPSTAAARAAATQSASSNAPANAPAASSVSWGQPVAVDQGLKLNSVSCAASTLCAAADNAGNLYVYDGTSWSSSASTSNLLGTVSCPSTSFCATVGYDSSGGNGFIYTGSSWSAPDLIDPGYKLHSVSCASPAFCVAGASVNMFVYSGGSWSAPESVDPDDGNGKGVESVSCVQPSTCAAVDAIGNALIYSNGSWSAPDDIDGSAVLDSVSCASASFCVAVDANGNALTYSGGSWSSPHQIDSAALESVSCASASFCVAVDANGNALTYSGGSWSSPHQIDSAALESVSCAATSFCEAVDANGNALSMT